MNYLQFARTLSIVRELAKGKQLRVPDGIIAMGEDMTIGYIIPGTDHISGMAELTLKQLNSVCEKYDIGLAIPDTRDIKQI